MADLGDFLGWLPQRPTSCASKNCFACFFWNFPQLPANWIVWEERSAATCCRVVSADKKEEIQVQCRSVLIANNILMALFITLRFSSDYFTGWPDHSAALFAVWSQDLVSPTWDWIDLWPNVGVIEQNSGSPTGFACRENSDFECWSWGCFCDSWNDWVCSVSSKEGSLKWFFASAAYWTTGHWSLYYSISLDLWESAELNFTEEICNETTLSLFFAWLVTVGNREAKSLGSVSPKSWI